MAQAQSSADKEGLHVEVEEINLSDTAAAQPFNLEGASPDYVLYDHLPVIDPYQAYENLTDYETIDQSLEGEDDWITDSGGSNSGEDSDESDDTIIAQHFNDFRLDPTSPGPPPSRPLPAIPVFEDFTPRSSPVRGPRKMPGPNVPKPGPAKLGRNSTPEEWLEEAKQCHYLPEPVMKQLCERVKECLMEGEVNLLALGNIC